MKGINTPGQALDEVKATIESILCIRGKLALERQAYKIPPDERLLLDPLLQRQDLGPCSQLRHRDAEAFIEAFSVFTKKLRCARGICSLKARPTPDEVLQGTYAIKATDAFYSLLRPSEEVML
ncbi:MAG: hypothetical protein JEY71_16355 [Sphaerochaeta sp.]|nr:hypothetical protein [Sphaerochaeta sp.]